MNRLDKLRNLNSSDLELFSLKNKKMIGKVVEIYNLNTCLIILAFDNFIFKFKCRLNAIKQDDDWYKLYILVSDNIQDNKSISSKLLYDNNKLLTIYCHDFTKEGYLLVDLYNLHSNVSINKQL